MALDNEKIEFALALNLANFKKAANIAVGKVQHMDTEIRKSMVQSAAGAQNVGRNIAGIGLAAAAVVVGGLALLKKGLSETTELASIQENAEIRLAGVINATGGAAGYTLQQLRAMAGELQGLTTVGDETILAGQSILATFKEIKGDTFRDATAAAVDMSTVMGQDLKSSMVQLGKALNDPTQGMSALSRVGVSFTEEQKEMIKTLQASGDIMGAQAVILQELKSEFGGTAAAIRDTFAGSVTAAGNAYGDLKEEIGFAITKNQFFIEAAKLTEKAWIDLTGKVNANGQQMRDIAKAGALAIIDGIGGAVEVVRFFYNGWNGLKLAAKGAVWLIIKGAELLTGALRKVLFPLDLLLTGLSKIGFIKSNPLKDFQETLKGFGDFSAGEFTKLYDEVEAGNKKFDTVKDKIAKIKSELNALPTGKMDAAEELQKKTDQKTPDKKSIAPVQYGQNDQGFKLVNGVWQESGPVKNTVNNFRSPVQPQQGQQAAGQQAQAPAKVVEINLMGAKMQTSEQEADKLLKNLKKQRLTS